jgi:NAD(P)-dependent dehydrogenase (short-subunit alcohol dehydrogenase family)
MSQSFVVTGGGRGVGRAMVERLLADGGSVVAIELDPAALDWTDRHPAGRRVLAQAGDAADPAVAERAADLAQAAGMLAGWVNNAAVFRDAWIHAAPPGEVLDLIAANLNAVVVGCATAVRRFLAAGTGGVIVNVSSHQARRAVPGALPYATARWLVFSAGM